MVYVRPVQPILTIPNAATGPQTAALKVNYYKALRLFCEVNTVERVLIQQSVLFIDNRYLQAQQKTRAKEITRNISTIFYQFLPTAGMSQKMNKLSFVTISGI